LPHGTLVLLQPVRPPGSRGSAAGGFWHGGQGRRTLGLLGPNRQTHTAFVPVQVSTPQMWDQVGLIAALNQMALKNSNS